MEVSVKRAITALVFLVTILTIPASVNGDYYSWRDRVERWRDWYKSRGISENSGDNVEVIESAAQKISLNIAAECGGSQEQYLEYSRKLALTLNQKSGPELDRIIIKGSLPLGN